MLRAFAGRLTYLLASIGLHFWKVEADSLVQTVGIMAGWATLD